MKLASVFSYMPLAGHRFQIIGGVVQRVTIFVVNHEAGRQWPVRSFPNQNRAELPVARIGGLYECTGSPVFVEPYSHRTYRESLVRNVTGLEFGMGRQVDALHALCPRRVPFWECVRWSFPRSPLVADLVLARHAPDGQVPLPAALLAAKAGGFSAVRPHLERAAANFAFFCNHEEIIAHNGARSTDIACRRIEAAQAQGRLLQHDAPRKPVQGAMGYE